MSGLGNYKVENMARPTFSAEQMEYLLTTLATKTDFTELRDSIAELTRAQARTEYQMRGLERAMEKLAQAQARTEERVEELAQAQARTEERIGGLEERVGGLVERTGGLERAMERLAQAQARTEERVGGLVERTGGLERAMEKLAQAQARTEERLEELVQAQIATQREVGALSTAMGFGLEDLAHVILPAYLARTYDIHNVHFEREFIVVDVDKEAIEVDLFAEGQRAGADVIVIGEAKSRIKRAEARKFAQRVAALRDYFTVPIFYFMFGYWIHPSAEEIAREQQIELIVSYKLTR